MRAAHENIDPLSQRVLELRAGHKAQNMGAVEHAHALPLYCTGNLFYRLWKGYVRSSQNNEGRYFCSQQFHCFPHLDLVCLCIRGNRQQLSVKFSQSQGISAGLEVKHGHGITRLCKSEHDSQIAQVARKGCDNGMFDMEHLPCQILGLLYYFNGIFRAAVPFGMIPACKIA